MKKPIHPDSPKGREANAGVDKVLKAMADEKSSKVDRVCTELDNIVDEGFCKTYVGKVRSINIRAPWLPLIINGERVWA